MSPFWPQALPIEVLAVEQPRQFRWRGQEHSIQQVSDHWQMHTGWWDGEIWRDYWEVATEGVLWVLYRDLFTGQWYLERIYE